MKRWLIRIPVVVAATTACYIVILIIGAWRDTMQEFNEMMQDYDRDCSKMSNIQS